MGSSDDSLDTALRLPKGVEEALRSFLFSFIKDNIPDDPDVFINYASNYFAQQPRLKGKVQKPTDSGEAASEDEKLALLKLPGGRAQTPSTRVKTGDCEIPDSQPGQCVDKTGNIKQYRCCNCEQGKGLCKCPSSGELSAAPVLISVTENISVLALPGSVPVTENAPVVNSEQAQKDLAVEMDHVRLDRRVEDSWWLSAKSRMELQAAPSAEKEKNKQAEAPTTYQMQRSTSRVILELLAPAGPQ